MTSFEEIVPQVRGEVNVQPGHCSIRLERSQKLLEFPEISRPYLAGFASGLSIQGLVDSMLKNGATVEFSVLRKTLVALGDHGAIENYDVFRDHVRRSQLNEDSSVLKYSFFQTDLVGVIQGLDGFFQLVIFLALWGGGILIVQKALQTGILAQLALLMIPTLAISLRVWLIQLWSWFRTSQKLPLRLGVSLLGLLPELEVRNLSPTLSFVSLLMLIVPYGLLRDQPGSYPGVLQAMTLMTIYLEVPTLPGWDQGRARKLWIGLTSVMVLFTLRALFQLFIGIPAQSYLNLVATAVTTLILGYFLVDIVLFLRQAISKPRQRAGDTKSERRSLQFFEARREETLAAVPLFQSLPPAMIRDLTDKIMIANFSQRIFICRSGDRSTDLYLLLQGKVGVFKRNWVGASQLIVTLHPGSLFGEGGFFFRRPRDADVVTLEDSIICRIRRPKSIGWNHILDEQTADHFRKGIWAYQALAGSSLFAKLPQDALRLFLNRGRIINCQAGHTIVEEGTEGREFYILIQGRMIVTQQGRALRELNASDFFGEIALIRRTQRTATVKAIQDCLLFCLDESTFWQILSNNLDLACHLEKAALKRLRNKNLEAV